MPEIKNTFLQGKMNKDLDERLIPNGQYRDASNVEVSTSEGSSVGTVKNILGNKRVEQLVEGNFRCVGSIANEQNNKLYWFISKYDKDVILEYDVDNDIARPVLVDLYAGTDKAVLKFFGNIITGINIIDNLLFWTDNHGEPKKINIDVCRENTQDINSHTKLSFENGSFNGITAELVTPWSGNSSGDDIYFNGTIVQKTGRYMFVELEQLKAMLGVKEDSDIPGSTTIRHYRDGNFLGTKQVTIAKTVAGGTYINASGEFGQGGNASSQGPATTDFPYLPASDFISTGYLIPNHELLAFHIGDVVFGNNIKIDIQERHITVVKPKPLNAPAIKINHSENATSTSKIPNLFETKFPRFSYRYKYRDGEFSSFAPFTEPVFNPKYTKNTNMSIDGSVMYNQDTAYDIKDGYNKAMVNAIHSVELSDFITSQTPEDIVEIDILYKQENSNVIYSIGTIKNINSEWHHTSNHEGLGLDIGIGKSGKDSGSYYAKGGNTKGKYIVTTENIYAALPANQLLRPWDNVPRKALAQEVTGNRVVYGNYLQNYNIGSQPKITVDYSDRKNRLGTFDSQGLPSVKSQRNYQLGVVYCDKHGRETPVFTSNDGAINIPWQDVDGNKNASKSNQLSASVSTNFPEWVDSFKVFVKETSNEYYNLTMDRAWVTKSTYELDNSEGHLWISFPSSDRNKISEEDYIILKKKIGVGEDQVSFENKFKVIDIKNEAPDAIKYQLVNYGTMKNYEVDTTGADGVDSWSLTQTIGNGYLDERIDTETNKIRINIDNWLDKSSGWDEGGNSLNIPLHDVGAQEHDPLIDNLYLSWSRVGNDGLVTSSKKYKIINGFKGPTNYVLTLNTTITKTDADIAHALDDSSITAQPSAGDGVYASDGATPRDPVEQLHPDLVVQIERKELKDTEDFSGKFFVKISKNQISSIVENGNEISNLDKFQVTSKYSSWYWEDDIASATPSVNPLVDGYGLTNYNGFKQIPSTSNSIHYVSSDTGLGGINVTDYSYDGKIYTSDHYQVWENILTELDNENRIGLRFFIDSMFMAAGQSEASDYAKYCCITWAGCTKDNDNSAEESSWSYPPLKTWFSDFSGETTNNIISTSPISADRAWARAENTDGWIGPLQNVNRDTPTADIVQNHINGLEGLVTTTDYHATGARRWLSGMNGVDYGAGEDTKTYSNNGEEERHFMHLSFFAPGKDLHDGNWPSNFSTGGATPSNASVDGDLIYGEDSWAANLQGIWGGGVFTGTDIDDKFGDTDDFYHLPMEGNHEKITVSGSTKWKPLQEAPGPGVGQGYDLDYRELHERQWDPTFSHNPNSDLVGDPGNKIRDFIRNLYPGSRFRFHRVDTPGSQVDPKIFPEVYTIKKVSIKKLYNHTSWREPYNRYDATNGYENSKNHTYDELKSVEATALTWLDDLDASGQETDTTDSGTTGTIDIVENLQEKIVQFGKAHNRRLCYIIELDKNPANETNPLAYSSENGMCGEIDGDNYTDIEFLDPVQDMLLSDLNKFPAIWEIDPKKKDVDLDIYYEASNNIPVRINEKTNELFAPIGCKVEIINPISQEMVSDVHLSSWDNNVATFDPGFEAHDGTNEIDYTNVLFKFIREDGSYTVAQAGGQQLIGDGPAISLGRKTEFVFKEDIGDNIKVGLGWYNCFSFGNGLESNRIKDDFNEMFISNGVKASTTIQETYEEERRKYGLIYSGIYNSNSGVNDLNQFIMAEKITKDLNPTYGSIQKLFSRNTDLVTFCEDRVLKILANKDAVFNADGNTQLTATQNVLGQTVPFVGDYGISKNPESFASESYRAYFTDKQRGAVLRLSKDGLTPISKSGMHDWFRDNLSMYTSLIGTYDSYKEDYNITLSNTYTENIIFNTYFKQGVDSQPLTASSLSILNDGAITQGSNFEYSYVTKDIGSDTEYDWATDTDFFLSTVVVKNHPAIPKGYYQPEDAGAAAVDAVFATESIETVDTWTRAVYAQATSLTDDGWWWDPRFSSNLTGDIWGTTAAAYTTDAQVNADLTRHIKDYQDSGIDITEGSFANTPLEYPLQQDGSSYSSNSGSWPSGCDPKIEKKVFYPAPNASAYTTTNANKISRCITRNSGGQDGIPKAVTFDRARKSSYISVSNVATTASIHPSQDANGVMKTYADNANNYGYTLPNNFGHGSIYNGDELHVEIELACYPTITKATDPGGSLNLTRDAEYDRYGYNHFAPRLRIYNGDGDGFNNTWGLVKPSVPQSFQAHTTSNPTYNPYKIQTTAQNMSDFDPTEGAGGTGIGYKATTDSRTYVSRTLQQAGFKHTYVSNGNYHDHQPTDNIPLLSVNDDPDADNTQPVTVKLRYSFKFRDPRQQTENGNADPSASNYNPNGIEAVQLLSNFKLRLENTRDPYGTGSVNFNNLYGGKDTTSWFQTTPGLYCEYHNDTAPTGIYPLVNPLFEVKSVKIKKGFSVIEPTITTQTQVTVYDDPNDPGQDDYTGDQAQAAGWQWVSTGGPSGNGGYVINYDAWQDALAAAGNLQHQQPAIPPADVPAFIEVEHQSENWTFVGNHAEGIGLTLQDDVYQWLKARTQNWFGNNRTAVPKTENYIDQSDGSVSNNTVTWYEPGPDPDGLINYAYQTPQEDIGGTGNGYPFNKTINGVTYAVSAGDAGTGYTMTTQSDGSVTYSPGGSGSVPSENTFNDVQSDNWRIQQDPHAGWMYYEIETDITTNPYEYNEWCLVDIEFTSDVDSEFDINTTPTVGSGGDDGYVAVPSVAEWGTTYTGGIGNPITGSSINAHVKLLPYWRTEYGGTPRWVLRAVYYLHPNNSWEATNGPGTFDKNKFILRFYNFENNKIFVEKIITRKIDYTNGSGTATEWDIDFDNGTYDQINTLSGNSVYDASISGWSSMYYNNNHLCWNNVANNSTWSQDFGANTPENVDDWVLKFTVADDPITSSFSGKLDVMITNNVGDYTTSPNTMTGLALQGVDSIGDYEVTFDFNGNNATWQVVQDTVPYTGATINAYHSVFDGTDTNFENKIRFQATSGETLTGAITNIILTNQKEVFQGGTVASWNFDGFEPTIDQYIVWHADDNSESGKIQFTDCPTFDPSGSGVEAITANQLIDKTINRYEKYKIEFTYNMVNKLGYAGLGLLHMYYFNSDGWGFRIGSIGDPSTGNYIAENVYDTDGSLLKVKATTTVGIGDGSTPSDTAASEVSDIGIQPLRNTIVIRRESDDNNNVTGWIDDISMKRVYEIELNEDGTATFPETTVTFSEDVNGWTSFKSFVPEGGVSLSKKYFTFKDAYLYQHYVPLKKDIGGSNWISAKEEEAENYNIFYTHLGERQAYSPSTVKAVLNMEPSIVKTFNTLNYEGSQAHITNPKNSGNITIHNAKAWAESSKPPFYDIDGWKCTEIKTDMDTGSLRDFIKKEGKWFGYIKGKSQRGNLDTSLFSTQGIGTVANVVEVATNTTGRMTNNTNGSTTNNTNGFANNISY